MQKEDIRKDLNDARKAGDNIKKSALEAVLAAILLKDKTEAGKQLAEADIIDCIAKEIKIQKEIFEMYDKAGDKRAAEISAKIEILSAYLPKQLSDEEVLAYIKELDVYGGDKSPKAKGMIIKGLMPIINGKYEKSKVNGLVETYLNNK